MAELLRLDSTRLYGNNSQGCIWGLFHVFDSYRRRENKRMLSYRRLGGTDILISNDEAGSGEDTMTDKGAINIVEDRANNMNKSSGKTRILNFIGKNLLKRQKRKEKMPHSSTQLMRTISVHQLESSDYATSGELGQMTSDSEGSTIALSLDETNFLAKSEHESLVTNGLYGSVEGKQRALEAWNAAGFDIGSMSCKLDELGNHLLDEHIILKEKLFEARDALLKQKDSDPKGVTVEFSLLSKIFMDTLQLFNTNREALYNVCKGQNSFAANDIQALVSPAKDRASNRSVSLAGLELSRNAAGIPIPSRMQIECDEFINQGSKPESGDLPTKTFGIVPNLEVVPGSNEPRKLGETKTVLSRLRELKQRLKGVIVESKKERHRISMDRILDKVPSGKKLPEDEEDDRSHLKDEPVARGGQGFKFNRVTPGSSIEKFSHNGVQRSRSLTESLDRYSQLLDSISVNEVRKAPERSNSMQEGSGLLHRKLPKTHRRMPSNPEFLSSFSFVKDVQSEVYIAFKLSKKLTLEPLDGDLAPTVVGSDNLNKDIVMQPAVEEIVYEQEQPLDSNIVANAVKSDAPDEIATLTVETSITETKGNERHPGSVNECLQILPFQFSKILVEKIDLFNEQESQIEDEPNVKPEKTSPISVLDPNIEEPVSPLKLTVMAGSDQQQLQENVEDPLPCPKAWNDVDFNEFNIAKLSKLNFYHEITTTSGDQAYSSHAHVDEKDSARFNYVKHILSKSSYEALLCETEDSSIEVDAASPMLCDMPFEEQLIYDLINEVLFEIYEYSTVSSSWLSRFHSKIRSMPTGSYLLEEVWAEIRWHLSSPQGLDAMVDKILARNFTKTDDWMNLYRDAECFGLLLEQLILDDLLDEVILDVDEL
ncbi:hypothetical protein IEQ34_008317 [Dendrobium chrysotoxum]|uniref:DUF4378 domain-containing protein n=1 Tax=Dendrobium chrysotoxum TaxID=161865 RepID=A0AAV7GYU9_DENCH|nr:hypothetical protein IEQ34_008317 [Dendrobium chrysotoxum]